MKPKGVITLGSIYIIIALLYIVGIIKALNSLKYSDVPIFADKNIILNFVYSFIAIIGFFYAAIKILNLNYTGVYVAYVVCSLRIFDGIRYNVLYTLNEINSPRISVFIISFLVDLFILIFTIRYFANSDVRKYFEKQE